MSTFQVNDMTCGHCAGVIRAALTALDAGARVDIDVGTRRVVVESASATAAQLQDAIAKAGYTPIPAESTATATGAGPRRGCCCG